MVEQPNLSSERASLCEQRHTCVQDEEAQLVVVVDAWPHQHMPARLAEDQHMTYSRFSEESVQEEAKARMWSHLSKSLVPALMCALGS